MSLVPSLVKLAAKEVVAAAAVAGSDIELEGMSDPIRPDKVVVYMGVDTTASMEPVLSVAKKTAQSIINKLQKLDMEVEFHIAAVNDYEPWNSGEQTPVKWDVDIDSMEAEGGGDEAEAYSTFLSEACDKAMKTSNDHVRYVIMLGDAYAHGMPPVQGLMFQTQDSYPSGDPSGDTIPLCMQKLKSADVTFIHVMCGDNSKSYLWASANAKATDGVVIPMDMTDMNKVPHVLSTYVASQTSMVLMCKRKQCEYEGKSEDEITKIISEYMDQNNMRVCTLSETIEHENTDDFLSSIQSINLNAPSDPGRDLFDSFRISSTQTRRAHSAGVVFDDSAMDSQPTVRRAVSMTMRMSQRY